MHTYTEKSVKQYTYACQYMRMYVCKNLSRTICVQDNNGTIHVHVHMYAGTNEH